LILAPVGEREVDFGDRRHGLISGNSNARSPATPVVVDAVDEPTGGPASVSVIATISVSLLPV
jgi:hypothetical protein